MFIQLADVDFSINRENNAEIKDTEDGIGEKKIII